MDKIIGLENKGVSEIKRLCAKHGIPIVELSVHLHLLPSRVYEILRGQRRITVGTDLRLCRFFKLGEGHFYALQTVYDFAMEKAKSGEQIAGIVPVDKIVKKMKVG